MGSILIYGFTLVPGSSPEEDGECWELCRAGAGWWQSLGW